jgi:methionyl-tRNA formyltransferase
MTANYVVATVKPWNLSAFQKYSPQLPGSWHLLTEHEQLTVSNLRKIKPRFVFFPHWSWIVPDDVLAEFECVCLHMTDLPYGRGGSPLQNLILRGHQQTKVTALRMTAGLDEGPIYFKADLSLLGSAEEIFHSFSEVAWELIRKIAQECPEPQPQQGEPVLFKRLRPSQSEIQTDWPVAKIYDQIRMLDAETYPPAFVRLGDWKIEFSKASLKDGQLKAEAVFKLEKSHE